MKVKHSLFLFVFVLFSCTKEVPLTCACVGYNAEGRNSDVICDSCDAGITKATCEDYNKENLDGLTWVYEEYEEADFFCFPDPAPPPAN